MLQEKPVLLLTGRPGIGKSTVIQQVIGRLAGRAGGFYTRELRSGGERAAFEMVTLSGPAGLLATMDQALPLSRAVAFERYRVSLAAIEAVAVPALRAAAALKQVVFIDEIGPMEIFSELFCEAVWEVLEDPQICVVGTVVQRPYRFADQVKAHRRVALLPVTLENRDRLAEEILGRIE